MTKEPFIAHSELTNEIYIVCGSEKYLVTEQVIKAMQNTGRLEQPTSDDCVSWIPVSERLPKQDGEYLLYGKIDEDEENYIFIGEYDSCGEQFGIWQEQFDRTTLGCLGSEFFEYSSVLAWQPLPKPYKEKRGNKDGSN